MLRSNLTKPKLLIADDDQSLLLLFKTYFSPDKYDVEQATDGIQALALASERLFNVIVLDINMPGIDGISVCKNLRNNQINQFTPILLVTGDNDKTVINTAFLSGATDLIIKPIKWEVFVNRIEFMSKYSRLVTQLQQQSDEQASLLSAVPDYLCRINESGYVFTVNSPDNYRLPWLLENYNDKHLSELLPESIAKPLQSLVVDCLFESKREHYEFSIDDQGQTYIYEAKISPLNSTSIIAIIRDVSQLRKVEHLNLRLGKVLDNSYNEILILDANKHCFVQTNLSAQKNLGYSPRELSSMSPADILSSDQLGDLLEGYRLLKDGVKSEITILSKFRRKDSSRYPVEIRMHYNLSEQPSAYILIAQDITKRKENEEYMMYLAYYDSLTGLANRQFFMESTTRSLQLTKRNNSKLALLFLDLDRFKRINDTLGHTAGDELLKEVGIRLLSCVRDSDLVSKNTNPGPDLARLAGDEFVILLEQIKSADEVSIIAKRIVHSISQPVMLDDQEVTVSTSIGISMYPEDGEEPEELLKHADIAMYHVKKKGRSGFEFFHSSMNERAMERLQLEQNLHDAVKNNEFVLHYQPQVSLKNQKIIGFEALVRWNHPVKGLVPPNDFIPLAEDTGLIIQIGEWALREACKTLSQWHQQGMPLVKVAVNFSAKQFNDPLFLIKVKKALKDAELDPKYLEVEMTESIIMTNVDESIKVLLALKDMGIKLSVDDFGTGYSSLSYLKRFPLNILKIDRAFIKDITTDKDDDSIVSAIIAMAHSLNLEVVAEGVETVEQLSMLKGHDDDIIQGFLVSKPLEADACLDLLKDNSDYNW